MGKLEFVILDCRVAALLAMTAEGQCFSQNRKTLPIAPKSLSILPLSALYVE